MSKRLSPTAAAAAFAAAVTGGAHAESGIEKNLERINLPPGFEISVFAEVPGAREMVVGKPMGVVFVGSRASELRAVVDKNKDRVADSVITMRDDLNAPSGLAYWNGYLYVSEQHRFTRYAAAELGVERRTFTPEVLFEGYPDKAHHGTRATELGPDGKFYVAIGVPCNICMPEGIEDAIIRLNPDGSGMEVFARGIRNSVGMDFHPETGELFFTDNNVDNMGDDSPPGEFNHAPEAGLHFGFPWYAGGHDRHSDWADREVPVEVTFPAIEFQAHVAALGMAFIEGDHFPAEYRNDAIVAQHGSWNRSTPVGYRLVRIRFDGHGRVDNAEFLRTSGDTDVDRPILDAIYEWRAEGPQLKELQSGTERQTISVEITILL